ncbi:hypothetical protein [Azospirillum sp. sgz301742]
MNELIPASAPAPEVPRHYKIGRKLERALHAYVTKGGHITNAAQDAGIRRETLGRALKRPHVQQRLDEIVRDFKTRLGLKALMTIDGLMDAKSEYVRIQAALGAADRTGHGVQREDVSRDTTLVVNIKID